MLRKSFLIIGIVLLVFGFFFFYWASRVNWDYVSEKKETVEIGYYALVGDFGFGNCYPYQIYTPNQSSAIEMQTNDFLTVQCPDIIPNETVYIVLFDTVPSKATLLNYSSGLVSYTNHQNNVSIYPYLLIPENQNNHTATVSIIKTLHHYETPQWVYFSIGIILSSLAVIPIFKSNSTPKPCYTEGSSQAERGLIARATATRRFKTFLSFLNIFIFWLASLFEIAFDYFIGTMGCCCREKKSREPRSTD